jgi:hypothetical protein
VIFVPVPRPAAATAATPTVVVAVVLVSVVARIEEDAAVGESRPGRVGVETVAVEVPKHEGALGVMIVTIVADVAGGIAFMTAIGQVRAGPVVVVRARVVTVKIAETKRKVDTTNREVDPREPAGAGGGRLESPHQRDEKHGEGQ